MKVGRIDRDGVTDFAAALDGSSWYALSDLGIEARETAELIRSDKEVRAALETAHGPPVAPERFASPILRPSKIFGIGLNYMDHIRETQAEPPETPVVFAKFPNALVGPYDEILVNPDVSEKIDYEAELAVVIGHRIRNVPVDEALEAVYGYCVANDVSARDVQKAEPQFSRSKSFDTFCPIGPWITTSDEIGSPQELRISSTVNGEPRQDSTTAEMIFPVPELVSFLSQGLTLEPGDVILTGTPHGVGFVMDPPRFLSPGDVVRCEVEGLGAIENRVGRALS